MALEPCTRSILFSAESPRAGKWELSPGARRVRMLLPKLLFPLLLFDAAGVSDADSPSAADVALAVVVA